MKSSMIAEQGRTTASVIILAAMVLFSGCKDGRTGSTGTDNRNILEEESDESKTEVADQRIKSEVATIRSAVASSQSAGMDVVTKLVNFNDTYPGTPEIIEALASVHMARKDWSAISELYRSVDRNLVNEGLYIRSLLMSHAYAEAVAFLEQKPNRNQQDSFLLGYALYHNGDSEKAISELDEVIKQPGGQSADALLIRGMAAIQVNDWETADAMLSKSLELQADNAVAMTALARVKRKLGDEPFAELLENQAIEARNKATMIESRMIQVSALSQELNEAWAGRKLDECRRIIAKLMPNADEKTRAVLDNYLLSIDRLEGK